MSESKTEYEFKPRPQAIVSMSVEERDKLVADARRVALLEAAKAVCEKCRLGKPVFKQTTYNHIIRGNKIQVCKANEIRRLMESK